MYEPLLFLLCCVLRVHGMTSVDVCLIVAMGLKMSLFDLLLCTKHTHTRGDYLHKVKSLEHGCRCTAAAAAAAALLLPYTDW